MSAELAQYLKINPVDIYNTFTKQHLLSLFAHYANNEYRKNLAQVDKKERNKYPKYIVQLVDKSISKDEVKKEAIEMQDKLDEMMDRLNLG